MQSGPAAIWRIQKPLPKYGIEQHGVQLLYEATMQKTQTQINVFLNVKKTIHTMEPDVSPTPKKHKLVQTFQLMQSGHQRTRTHQKTLLKHGIEQHGDQH